MEHPQNRKCMHTGFWWWKEKGEAEERKETGKGPLDRSKHRKEDNI
jgi:hypothetical protein